MALGNPPYKARKIEILDGPVKDEVSLLSPAFREDRRVNDDVYRELGVQSFSSEMYLAREISSCIDSLPFQLSKPR